MFTPMTPSCRPMRYLSNLEAAYRRGDASALETVWDAFLRQDLDDFLHYRERLNADERREVAKHLTSIGAEGDYVA